MTSIKDTKLLQHQAHQSQTPEHSSKLTSKAITRRRFLELFATGTGSIILAGCGGGGSSTPTADKSSADATPSSFAATPPSGSTFWGINGHWSDYGSYAAPLSTQLASLKDLGFKHYRQGIFEISHAQYIASSIPSMSGITILPTVVGADSPLNYPNETSAYSDNYSFGQTVAKLLKGKVPCYEVGGEFDSLCNVVYDGSSIDQYDQNAFILCRGVLRGLIDGIKSVDTQTPIMCGATAGWLHTAFPWALWFGQQPDGSGGHPTVRWDITMYHWYSDMGDITNTNGTTNVLATLRDTFQKPIWITEFGCRPESEADAQAFLADNSVGLQMFYRNRAAYNIIGVTWFELYDSVGDMGYGLMSDPYTKKSRYATMKSFLAAHSA